MSVTESCHNRIKDSNYDKQIQAQPGITLYMTFQLLTTQFYQEHSLRLFRQSPKCLKLIHSKGSTSLSH